MPTCQQTTTPAAIGTFQMPAPAVVGVAGYLVGLALPVGWAFPLLILGGGLLLQLAAGDRDEPVASSHARVIWVVVAFVLSFACSAWASADPARSVRLSVALLPGLLCLVALRGVRLGESEQSALGAAAWVTSSLAATSIIVAAWLHPDESPFTIVSRAGVAAIVVPNDTVLLAVLSPISIVLLRSREAWKRVAGGVGLALTVVAIGLLASRVAFLTLIVALGTILWFVQPRLAAAGVVVAAGSALGVDALLGWPMLAKLGGPVDPRLSLWAVEWQFFVDSPLLGHGPFTLAAEYEPMIARLALPEWVTRDFQATVPWAHNLWFEALGERGVVGFAALVLLFASTLAATLRRARATMTVDGRHVVPLAALMGLAIASFFELTFLHEWIGVVLFVLWAIGQALDPDRPIGGS